MLKYATFFKELLSNKRKLKELSNITLSEECSAILQNKLLEKPKDLRSQPFLATVEAINDIREGQLVLRVKDEKEIVHDDPLELYLVQGEGKKLKPSIKDPP